MAGYDSPAMTDYNSIARSYTTAPLQPAVVISAKALVQAADDTLPFSEATQIVDLGCGPGIVTAQMMERYGTSLRADVRISALDKSPEMLEQVAALKAHSIQSLGSASFWHNVTILQGDAQDLVSVADSSCSHILAGLLLFLLPDARRALHECHRVLKPGGVVAFSSWPTSDWQSLMSLTTKIRPGSQAYRVPAEWRTVESVQELAEDAGFRDVRCGVTEAMIGYDDPLLFCNWVVKKMPGLQPFVVGFSEEEKSRLVEEMVQWLISNIEAQSRSLRFSCLVCTGHR